MHTSFPITVLPRLWILGRNSAVISSQVPPKMRNGKVVEPIIGWFAEDKRNSAPVAMVQNLPMISFSGPACVLHVPSLEEGRNVRVVVVGEFSDFDLRRGD
jgi:hypothetical protein